MLNMMTSQIYKTVLEKCNYESLFCMVLLKAVVVLLKTKCNVTCYAAYVSSTLTFFDEQEAQQTLESAKSGKSSTMSNDGPLDLFHSMDSGTALFLLENFRIIVCAILYRKSSEDNEGADSILL